MYVNYHRFPGYSTPNMYYTIDHFPCGNSSFLVPGTEDWTFDDFCNYVMGS